jgi:hypothetical protein
MYLSLAQCSLNCSVCSQEITDVGYLPATVDENEYEPHPQNAVCDVCGFNKIGMEGCAPELTDIVDNKPQKSLLYIRIEDDEISVISEKE